MPRPSGRLDSKLRKDNRSGHAGVWFAPKRERWNVQIQMHHKRYHVGTYKTFSEAVAARRKAEEVLR
jgi:hypothetical protein